MNLFWGTNMKINIFYKCNFPFFLKNYIMLKAWSLLSLRGFLFLSLKIISLPSALHQIQHHQHSEEAEQTVVTSPQSGFWTSRTSHRALIHSGQMRLSAMSSWFLGTARKLSQSTESSWRHPATISRRCLLVGSSVLLDQKQTVWDVSRAAKFTNI